MKDIKTTPRKFLILTENYGLDRSRLFTTHDGFFAVGTALSDILAKRDIFDFPDNEGKRYDCDKFFDDWYLYSVKDEHGCVYSLFKLREQEDDFDYDIPADGDTPGVTVSFISFDIDVLLKCLDDPTDTNRLRLSDEIGRVVSYKGQRHHKSLKSYFKRPASRGAYLIASLYIKHISDFIVGGSIEVPKHYREIAQRSTLYKKSCKYTRLPDFISALNEKQHSTICDGERIYVRDKSNMSEEEASVILATHTGNVSVYSFAAEVEYHAKFLTPLARIRVPFFGKSVYDSAIRADMTIDDTEFEGYTPFYRLNSRIVKRQMRLHRGEGLINR